MKELKVGMWAYSKTCRDYGIGKIVNVTENGQGFKGDLIDIQYKYSEHAIENQDVVASYNIIDLIKVGDYVNGKIVISIYEQDNKYYQNGKEFITHDKMIMYGDMACVCKLENLQINSIVTKEQFDSMKYVVGDKE